MARRSEHTQDEIKQIVTKAAENIVVEAGLTKLKARNIAMEIGYTVGSIYMVFDSMADLVLHLKSRTLDDIALHLQQVPKDPSAEQCIVSLCKAHLSFAQQHTHRWQMLFDQGQTAQSPPPDWYTLKVAQLFKPIELQFQRLAPNAPAGQLQRATHALWGGVNGICTLALTGSLAVVDAKEIETTVVLLVENFIRGWKLDAS
jgi:hypothetical protein